MKEYHKINSIYKRHGKGDPTIDPELKNKLIIGDYAQEEFSIIKRWSVEEKIDGTNIRVHYTKKDGVEDVVFGGRTENANIPAHLSNYLFKTLTKENLASVFEGDHVDVVLYGEGIGPKINGNIYGLEECRFVLFDVRVGHFWLKREDVYAIAKSLGVMKPTRFSITTEEEIVEYCKSGTIGEWQDWNRYPASKLFFHNSAMDLEEFEKALGIEENAFPVVNDPETGEVIEEGKSFLTFNPEKISIMGPTSQTETEYKPKDSVRMEGVVCRPEPELLDRAGHRIIWKLKCKDLA